MNKPNPSLFSFVRRMMGSLAIGPILREEYLYEVHGPFVAVASQPTRSLSRRLIDRLAASMRGIGRATRPTREARDARIMVE